MDWKPLNMTKSRVEDNVRRFGRAPEDLTLLFIDRAQDPEACERACNEILKNDPKNGMVLLYKAVLAQDRGDFKAVLKYAKPITLRTPLILHAWQLRGMGELLYGSPEYARLCFMHYGHFYRSEPWPYCLIAMTYLFEQDMGPALYVLDEAMTSSEIQDKKILLWVRAIIEEKAGDVQAALTHLLELQMLSQDEMRTRAAAKIHDLMVAQHSTAQ